MVRIDELAVCAASDALDGWDSRRGGGSLAWGHVKARIRIGLGGNPDFGRRKHEREAVGMREKLSFGLLVRWRIFARGPASRFAAAAHGVFAFQGQAGPLSGRRGASLPARSECRLK